MSKRHKAQQPSPTAPQPPHPTPAPPQAQQPTPPAPQQEYPITVRYHSYRSELIAHEGEQGKEADKWILTISGVALGFSLTFVKDFVGGAQPKYPWLLYSAWGGFGIPVALILFNIQSSYSAARKYLKITDDRYKTVDPPNYKGGFFDEVTTLQKKVLINGFLETINWISLTVFVAGLIALGAFVAANAKLGERMTKNNPERQQPTIKTNQVPEKINGTANPPSPPAEAIRQEPPPPPTQPKK